jgi:hypothetical protein
MSLVLQSLGSDESLDLGGFGVWLGAFFLGCDFSTNDELAAGLLEHIELMRQKCDIPNIILLAQTKEFSNLGGTFGT